MKFKNIMLFTFLSITLSVFSDDIWNSAYYGDINSVKNFIEKIGVDVNTTDKNLNTPLHFASSAGKYEIIQYLIIKNANVNLLNNQGFSPFWF